ncbi:hypothetical protein GCM10027413_05010 [Conyzicola nivalis]|uniref:Uncharacterized protein n=1 Tax=Conyzicola nivalis TaxID=1477021 RepID=A0A916SP79_9MICO|nr:hypothetical protein [Conyzicola nivalis]GGB06761.1 hypothetical protein GCM10010979_21620 [Conyzicola nivalis]
MSAEYDAFGPWIDEVTSPEEVPRLYRDYPIDFADTRTVLKFPRDIARRDATPAMDLFDHLVIVTERALTVLSRADDRYTEVSVPHDQVAAITDWVNLLDARLVIQTLAGDVVSVAYNGSSNDSVTALVDQLRELAHRAAPTRGRAALAALPTLGLDDLGKKDALIVTSFRDLVRREPDVRLVAARGREAIASRTTAARLLDLVARPTLHGCAVGISDTELHIIGRREWIVRGGAPVVSRSRTIIALGLLGKATVAEHPKFAGVNVVTLAAGSSRIDIPAPQGSPTERVLLAL